MRETKTMDSNQGHSLSHLARTSCLETEHGWTSRWRVSCACCCCRIAVQAPSKRLSRSSVGNFVFWGMAADWSKAKLLYGLHTAAQFHHYAACWLGNGHIAAAAAGGNVFLFRLSDGKVRCGKCVSCHCCLKAACQTSVFIVAWQSTKRNQ